MMIDISEHEYYQLRVITDKLYNGNRGSDCPSVFTKALRLLDELEAKMQKSYDKGYVDGVDGKTPRNGINQIFEM